MVQEGRRILAGCAQLVPTRVAARDEKESNREKWQWGFWNRAIRDRDEDRLRFALGGRLGEGGSGFKVI